MCVELQVCPLIFLPYANYCRILDLFNIKYAGYENSFSPIILTSDLSVKQVILSVKQVILSVKKVILSVKQVILSVKQVILSVKQVDILNPVMYFSCVFFP